MTKRTDGAREDWDEKNPVHRRQLAQTINNALKGRLNSTGTFITNGLVVSTTVSDFFCGITTVPIIIPSSDAAYSMDIYPSTIGRGSFVVKHNTLTGTFYYVLIG